MIQQIDLRAIFILSCFLHYRNVIVNIIKHISAIATETGLAMSTINGVQIDRFLD